MSSEWRTNRRTKKPFPMPISPTRGLTGEIREGEIRITGMKPPILTSEGYPISNIGYGAPRADEVHAAMREAGWEFAGHAYPDGRGGWIRIFSRPLEEGGNETLAVRENREGLISEVGLPENLGVGPEDFDPPIILTKIGTTANNVTRDFLSGRVILGKISINGIVGDVYSGRGGQYGQHYVFISDYKPSDGNQGQQVYETGETEEERRRISQKIQQTEEAAKTIESINRHIRRLNRGPTYIDSDGNERDSNTHEIIGEE